MLMDDYAAILTEKINTIRTEQREKIMIAARLAAQTMLADGLIYVFGCGHSHILAEETFYRAGGLACVSPVFYEPLMLHESAAESSRLEKQAGLAAQVLSGLHLEKRDLMICISTSGWLSARRFGNPRGERGAGGVRLCRKGAGDSRDRHQLPCLRQPGGEQSPGPSPV